MNARNGYKFYYVSTPGFFLEFELPIDLEDDAMSAAHRRKLQRLEDAADKLRAPILSSPYRVG